MPAVRAAFLGWMCGVCLAACAPQISEQDLAARVAQAHFDWQNYQEDIKGQIGATPSAEWQGVPTRAWRDPQGLRIEFRITGPWTKRGVALPVMMRDPTGAAVQSTAAECAGERVTYQFPPSALASTTFDSIEVKFPHGERRMVLEKSAAP